VFPHAVQNFTSSLFRFPHCGQVRDMGTSVYAIFSYRSYIKSPIHCTR
jgi:hypothetical protein